MHFLNKLRNRWKYCLVIILISGLINEWLVYALMPWMQWPQFPSGSSESVKLLIVSDPQLLGERLTMSGIFGFFARWDADRFIKNTFNVAYDHVKPDIVIFLGDLLDEGENADDEEYFRYLKRFKSVFNRVNFNRVIILPGDNDIGGEYEPPSIANERRFDRWFKNDNLIKFNFLEFIKVNYMTQSNNYLLVPKVTAGTYRVVLSHIPLTPTYSSYTKRVFQHLQPHLILSAHEHSSVHLVSVRNAELRTHAETSFLKYSIFSSNLTEYETHEIMNPTCSYRMGTLQIGYSAMIIGPAGNFTYIITWLPNRFHQLYLYVGLLVVLLFLLSPLSLTSLKFQSFQPDSILIHGARPKRNF